MAQGSGSTIEICTAHGTKTVTLDQAGNPSAPQQAPCPHCDQCMSPALVSAALAPALVQPIRYALRAETPRTAAMRLPPARAPPRPPSQGPPALLNV
jgi:hypothetical protein